MAKHLRTLLALGTLFGALPLQGAPSSRIIQDSTPVLSGTGEVSVLLYEVHVHHTYCVLGPVGAIHSRNHPVDCCALCYEIFIQSLARNQFRPCSQTTFGPVDASAWSSFGRWQVSSDHAKRTAPHDGAEPLSLRFLLFSTS